MAGKGGAIQRKDDDFEARYMPAEGNVLHRDKRISRGLTALLGGTGLGIIALAVAIAFMNGASDKPVPVEALPFVVGAMTLLGVLIATIGLAMGILRTVVTDREVNVKYGLWGPRIPMENVVSCRAVVYRWPDFGGWGVRRGKNGVWAYVPAGDRAIEIVYREGGEEKRVLVGVADPETTATIITRAAARAASTNERARIEAAAPELPKADDDLEAELEALETEASAKIEAAAKVRPTR